MASPSALNPYETLGVPSDATSKAIRSAYLQLARELHPDVNPAPEAQQRFKDVTEAYAVLSDPKQRKAYDEMTRWGAFGTDASRPANDAPRPESVGERLVQRLFGGGPFGGGPFASSGSSSPVQEFYPADPHVVQCRRTGFLTPDINALIAAIDVLAEKHRADQTKFEADCLRLESNAARSPNYSGGLPGWISIPDSTDPLLAGVNNGFLNTAVRIRAAAMALEEEEFPITSWRSPADKEEAQTNLPTLLSGAFDEALTELDREVYQRLLDVGDVKVMEARQRTIWNLLVDFDDRCATAGIPRLSAVAKIISQQPSWNPHVTTGPVRQANDLALMLYFRLDPVTGGPLGDAWTSLIGSNKSLQSMESLANLVMGRARAESDLANAAEVGIYDERVATLNLLITAVEEYRRPRNVSYPPTRVAFETEAPRLAAQNCYFTGLAAYRLAAATAAQTTEYDQLITDYALSLQSNSRRADQRRQEIASNIVREAVQDPATRYAISAAMLVSPPEYRTDPRFQQHVVLAVVFTSAAYGGGRQGQQQVELDLIRNVAFDLRARLPNECVQPDLTPPAPVLVPPGRAPSGWGL